MNKLKQIWRNFWLIVDFSMLFISLVIILVFLVGGSDGVPLSDWQGSLWYFSGLILLVMSAGLTFLRIRFFGKDILFMEQVRQENKDKIFLQHLNYFERVGKSGVGNNYKASVKDSEWNTDTLAVVVLFATILALLLVGVFWVNYWWGFNPFSIKTNGQFYQLVLVLYQQFGYFASAILMVLFGLLLILYIFDLIIPQEFLRAEWREKVESYMLVLYMLMIFVGIILMFLSPLSAIYWQKLSTIKFLTVVSPWLFGSSFVLVNLNILIPWRKIITGKIV